MERYAGPLGLLAPIICGNGAHVIGPQGEEVEHRSLGRDVAEQIWDYADRLDLHLNVYSRKLLFYRKESEWSRMYHERLGMDLGAVAPREDALGHEITKMMIVDESGRIRGHRKALEPGFDSDRVHVTESEPEYLEFLPANTNKATGLASLAAALGIEQHETAAIGDYMNDLEMVQWAGLGGAVANATREVRESADFVGPSNDQAGVARFIDWILANGRQ